MSIIKVAVVITVGLLSHAAVASDTGLSKQFDLCMNKSNGVTSAMIDCIVAETKMQDARMNKAYKALVAELTSNRKSQLLTAQRAWLKFRDANCDYYADPDGGTMARVSSNDCVMSATASRAKELEGFAN